MNDYYKQFNVEYLKNVEFIENGYAKTQMRDDCISYIQYLENKLDAVEEQIKKEYETVKYDCVPARKIALDHISEILEKVED